MGSHVSVSRQIDAKAKDLYEMVSDVTRMGEWSPETESCRWIKGATGAEVGARFSGSNRLGAKSWKIESVVTRADPGKAFVFDATAGPIKYATWSYLFESNETGTLVTESCEDRRNKLLSWMGKMISGVADRGERNKVNIAETLDALKIAAEADR